MKKATHSWVERAEEDIQALQQLDVTQTPNVAGVQAQQAVEKFLKACWIELGSAVPMTHDLEELWIGVQSQIKLEIDETALIRLSPFGTSARYPAKRITHNEAIWAVGVALETCAKLKTWLEARSV
jgi:HEPN domain-containing protein